MSSPESGSAGTGPRAWLTKARGPSCICSGSHTLSHFSWVVLSPKQRCCKAGTGMSGDLCLAVALLFPQEKSCPGAWCMQAGTRVLLPGQSDGGHRRVTPHLTPLVPPTACTQTSSDLFECKIKLHCRLWWLGMSCWGCLG